MDGKRAKKQLKKNEIILLVVLGLLLYGAVVGKLLLKPEYEKYKEAKTNLETIQVEYDHILMQLENLEALKEAEQKAKASLVSASKKIPPVIDRERILLSMCNYASKSNVVIDNYTFTGQQVFPFEGFVIGPEAGNTAVDPNQLEADAEVMIVCGVQMTFKSFEEGLYQFLKAFETGERSIYLKDCSIEASDETGELEGTISMEYLAYKGKLADYDMDLGLTPVPGKGTVFPSPAEVIRKNSEETSQNIKKELEILNQTQGSGTDGSDQMDLKDAANTGN